MKPPSWRVKDILDATGGVFLSGDDGIRFSNIGIDSRKIEADDFFVAIKGEHHDGHDFIASVLNTGVRGLLVREDQAFLSTLKPLINTECVCIGVEDTTRALGDLAGFRRRQMDVKTVGITGSNGKTTTKEMVAGVLKGSFDILSTEGNLNNEIGLPLTLFRLNQSHQWAVLELGMNHPGEISRLAEISNPDIGVITNVGPSHLEGLGSIEGVARAKGELLQKMNPEGTAVLNADDEHVLNLAGISPVNICLFGQANRDAAIRAISIVDKGDELSFELVLPEETIPVVLKLVGKYMISNALAAASVGYLSGISASDIKRGIEAFLPVKSRMNILDICEGVKFIDDTYNANPASTEVAIGALSSLRKNHRSGLVMGDMLELGDFASSMHREIGRVARRCGVERLFITGDYASDVAAGAIEEGMAIEDICIGTKEDILEALIQWMKPGDWILVKGSRSMKMETIIQDLTNTNETMQKAT